jgi:hypothetical protein
MEFEVGRAVMKPSFFMKTTKILAKTGPRADPMATPSIC